MLTFTFAGDESGDGSFNFAKGASRYFVVTVIGTQNPDALRDLLSDVKQKSYLPKNFDFHFHWLLQNFAISFLIHYVRLTLKRGQLL